jgi:hypothetical protein
MSTEAWWIDPRRYPGISRGARKRRRVFRTLVETVVLGILVLFLFLVVLHNRNFWWTYNLQSETTAKETVERYVGGIGLEPESANLARLNKSGVPLVNVLDYHFVRTVSKTRVDTVSVSYVDLNPAMTAQERLLNFDTYDQYLSQLDRALFSQVPHQAGAARSVVNMFDYKYVFLYELTLASRLGHRLYKQFVFEVEPTFAVDPPFVITAITERR